jgi:8-oxo-dGTP pyrophosphatase MutT (NUDIX family)
VHGEVIAQAAAIPYRIDGEGNVELLLVRRRDKKRWGLPKGVVEPGASLEQTARAESLEEAGVEGELSAGPVRRFAFRKWGGLCHVNVFLLRVTEVHPRYPEQETRERRWFRMPELEHHVIRKKVVPILEELPQILAAQGT